MGRRKEPFVETGTVGTGAVLQTHLKGENGGMVDNIILQNTDTVDNLLVLFPESLESESLNETDFTTVTKWSETGDFDITGGNAVYTDSSNVGVLTQVLADMLKEKVRKGNRWYKFTYTVSSFSGDVAINISTAFAVTATALTMSNGAQTTYVLAKDNFTGFVLSGTSSSGAVTLDGFSLKEVKGSYHEEYATILPGQFVKFPYARAYYIKGSAAGVTYTKWWECVA